MTSKAKEFRDIADRFNLQKDLSFCADIITAVLEKAQSAAAIGSYEVKLTLDEEGLMERMDRIKDPLYKGLKDLGLEYQLYLNRDDKKSYILWVSFKNAE